MNLLALLLIFGVEQCFSIKYMVNLRFFIYTLFQIKDILFSLYFVESFGMSRCWFCRHLFFINIFFDITIYFFSLILSMWWIFINGFLNIGPMTHSWDKSQVVIMFYSFYILLYYLFPRTFTLLMGDIGL